MITHPQLSLSKTDLATGGSRLPPGRRRRSRASRPLMAALAALLLTLGGQIARAGEAASPAATPTGLERAAAPNNTAQGFSARGLVARAEADLAAGHPGLAILSYRRARLLAPRAPAVTTGLARAESMAGLPADDASGAMRVARRLDADEWGWLGMIGLILAGAGLVALSWGLIRRGGFLALTLGGLGMASVGFLSAAEVTPPPDRAIVIAPDTAARIAPFEKAEQAFTVPEGAAVTVERTYDHYALIACPEGRGWVPEKGVEMILPSTGKRS